MHEQEKECPEILSVFKERLFEFYTKTSSSAKAKINQIYKNRLEKIQEELQQPITTFKKAMEPIIKPFSI